MEIIARGPTSSKNAIYPLMHCVEAVGEDLCSPSKMSPHKHETPIKTWNAVKLLFDCEIFDAKEGEQLKWVINIIRVAKVIIFSIFIFCK